jgi:hypothetical protein
MRLPGTRNLKSGRPGRWCRVVACDLHSPAVDVETIVGTLPKAALVAGPTRRHEPQGSEPSRLEEIRPREWFALLEPDRAISEYGYARCPLHDDHIPSLKLYDEPHDGWYCWACARGGDLIEYVAWRWHGRPGRDLAATEFRSLVTRLCAHLGVPAAAALPLLLGQHGWLMLG